MYFQRPRQPHFQSNSMGMNPNVRGGNHSRGGYGHGNGNDFHYRPEGMGYPQYPRTFMGPPPPRMGPPMGPPHMMGPPGPPLQYGMRPPYGQKRPFPNQHGRGGMNKKQKFDKREKPENFEFFCETCDKGFKTSEKYNDHVGQHEKCHYDGCSYTAAPKLISLHIKNQHRTGLAKKIWQLESKEDIEKWRAERRKHFPTKDNIEKKKKLLEERVERGEVVEEKYFGQMRRGGRGRGRGRGQGRGRGRGRHWQQQTGQDRVNKQGATLQTKPLFEGDPLAILAKEELSDSDHDEPTVVEAKDTSVQFAGALGLLGASYGTDSDESDTQEKPKKLPQAQSISQTHPHKEQKQLLSTETADNDECAVFDDQFNRKKQGRRRNNRKNKRKGINENSVDMSKPSLLEKLLAPEIRHERNVIMQCVRYIVKHEFFGLDKEKDINTKSAPDINDESKNEELDVPLSETSELTVSVDANESDRKTPVTVITEEDVETWEGEGVL